MKLLYYKSKKGNFGDDLNAWLWPKLLNNLNEVDDTYLIGIGSLLNNESPLLKHIKENKKIVFGTGVKPSKLYTKFKIDNTWDIRFLRGPLSSKVLNNQFEYITDSAYALRLIDGYAKLEATEKKYEVSLMPYFHSVDYFDWKGICNTLGFHYISPLSENGVEFTLQEIAASKYLITEAMHGAIAADILRVPWHRFVLSTPHTEGERIGDFKWSDWQHSIEVYYPEVTFIPFFEKNKIHNILKKLSFGSVSSEFFHKSNVIKDMIKKLSDVKYYQLSTDNVINEIDTKLRQKVDELKFER